MRSVIFTICLFSTAAVNAQQVYKCVRGKDVSYQSTPCDATHTVAKKWDATPDPEPTVEEIAQREAKRKQGAAESAQLSRAAGTNRTRSTGSSNRTSISAADARCNAAKERRARKLESVGLKRTFDLLRKLDDAVHSACKP